MDSRLILVVIGVIAATLGRSEAITCYSCDSISEGNCKDKFKSDGVDTCKNATTCSKIWVSEEGVTVFTRDCSTEPAKNAGCTQAKEAGAKGTYCLCSTDNCNDGQMVQPTSYNVFIGVAMATVVSIAWMNQI